MSPFIAGFIGIGILLLVFAMGMPIAFAMALIGMLGFGYLVSMDAGFGLLARDIFAQFSSYPLTVIPMFVLMGSFAFAAGIGRKLYEMAYTVFGQVHGGLTIASIAACAGFGAVSGSTAATCATIGKIAIPEMKRYNYSDSLATGSVAAAGGLGIIIPPSTSFIVYGILTEQSIGKLFISGVIPGIIIAILFMGTVTILCRLNPASGPSGYPTTWRQKLKALTGLTDAAILFLLTIGGLFAGWFSPTQAGAIGGAGALIIGLARRELTWQAFWGSAKDGMRISCMLLLLIAGATIFGHFMAVSKIPFMLADYLAALPVSSVVVMVIICLFWFIMGCFIDAMALIVLLIPIFFPVVMELGFDPIWFGVIITVVSMIALVTPPVGVNAYVIKGITTGIPLETIFRGIMPFLIPFVIALALLIAVPELATFLPGIISY